MAEGKSDYEGNARGFPVLRDISGKKLADGDFAQWLEDDRLHVKITYDFGDGRRIEEKAVLRQRPQLIQETWAWRELRDGTAYREFEVDFRSGKAAARKRNGNKRSEWSETIDVEPGSTFAGFGFTLAIRNLRERLIKGEAIELRAVGFTPKPRMVSVRISHGGVDRIRMAQRLLRADRFVIHPRIPWIAKLFVDVPDTKIWLTTPPPAGFVRWEGPLAEPNDSMVRVDLLPGGESGPATPVKAAARRQ